jgi:hypothetical protein
MSKFLQSQRITLAHRLKVAWFCPIADPLGSKLLPDHPRLQNIPHSPTAGQTVLEKACRTTSYQFHCRTTRVQPCELNTAKEITSAFCKIHNPFKHRLSRQHWFSQASCCFPSPVSSSGGRRSGIKGKPRETSTTGWLGGGAV